jgi:ankyrin repeat protein
MAPIHDAVAAGDLARVRALLSASPADVNAGDTLAQRAPLHLAAARGALDIAALLLDRGADVDERTEDGDTPLTYAVMRGHVDFVRLLVARGADVRHVNTDGQTIAQAAGQPVHPDIMRILSS